MKRRISAVILVFLIIFATGYPVYSAGTDEGYGEDQTSLGQFVDSFETSGNISVAVDVIRNSTLEVMELNFTNLRAYGNYTNNMKITVDHNRLGSNLTNFPILILISDSSGINNDNITGIFDEIRNSYQKIAITDEAFLNEYYIDVERWSLTDRLGALWISVNVSNLVDTVLYLHFYNGVSNNTAYVDLSGSLVAQNVWDANFIAVYHMGDGVDNQHIYDSTSYNRDGTKDVATEPDLVTGSVGTWAQEFDGNDIILLNGMSDVTDITMEGWFKADTTSGVRNLWFMRNAGGQLDTFRAYIDSGDLHLYWRTDGATVNPGVAFVDTSSFHYFVGVRQGISTIGYLDAVYNAGWDGVVGNGPISGFTHRTLGTNWNSLIGFLDGILDEIRFSNVVRTFDWINGTYFSGWDDLVDYDPLVKTTGFSPEGYFSTVDYLSDPFAHGSALTALINTSIPANTQILVEFSEDNSTWVFNDWQPLFGGFEAVDLRDLNYSAGYHCRFNLSTTDSSVTPRVYQNRVITTIGNFSTVYQNLTGEWIFYNLTAINVSTGIHDSGFLNSTYFIDGDTYNCSEVVGVPGYVVDFNVTGIDTRAISLWLVNYVYYDGSASHEINVEVWNFTSSAFVEIGEIPDQLGFEWQNFSVYGLRIPNDFVNSTGALVGRFYHADAGNINHDIFWDRINVLAFVPLESVAPVDEVFQFFWIVLAIALMLIGIMISKMWQEAGDS